jgi:hypothetical protein
MTVMLMVMSGMDPHMVSLNLRWVWFDLVGLVEVGFFRPWIGHVETP